MVRLENHYLSFNKMLLLAVGLWPYKQSRFSRIHFIFFSGILLSAIVVQLTVLLTARCTLDLILNVFSLVGLFNIFLSNYIALGVDVESVKKLLTQLQYIYDELKDKNEIAIADKYGCNARRSTGALIIIAVAFICLVSVIQVWSDVLGVILQINISHEHYFPIMTEYFIDQEKYFYLILLHMGTAVCIGITVTLAVGTMLIAFYHHTCGVFKIASYRIEHSINLNMIQNGMQNETLISERIICAVNIHRQAMELSIFMVSRFEVMSSLLIIFAVATLSFSLFRISTLKINSIEMITSISIATFIISYMFIANYLGQELTDHCRDIFLNAYNIQWYRTSLRIQKLILFLLRKGSTDFKVNIGGLFIPSLEGFAMLVKASTSYFTVIYSTQ